MRWRVGIDVGGTFTDLVAHSDAGEVRRAKVPSTPRAPEGAVADALRLLLRDVAPEEISYLGHATTIATNALLGQMHLELPKVVFVTTEGFRDLVEIGRQNRSAVYDLNVRRPKPLATREDRIVVRERMAFDGSSLVPLTDDACAATVAAVRERAPAAIAVGFLNSHCNDAHERMMAAALRTAFPDVPLTESAALVREEREYERFSTALVNAALGPIVGGYLARLSTATRELGITTPVSVMQSSGGTASLDTVCARPAAIVESGPASGAIAAAHAGRELGLSRVLAFDMGGTTAKAATIVDGTPEMSYEFEAAGATHSGRAARGSGYPVRFPFVDLAEVSAGGGTIAYLDAAGALRVGPLSAGADPGPACYGRGDAPTVTDANLVLGRLNPDALAGGTFAIDAARARAAVASVAAPFDGDVERAAAGIIALVDAQMAKVLRIVSVERGLDPRTFTLMAFGGGGPLHACALASDLDIARVVVPAHPGLFSAYGLVVAPMLATRSESFVAALEPASLSYARDIARRLTDDALRALRAQHDARTEIDLRYAGQSFDLTLVLGEDSSDELAARFHARHHERYGYAVPGERVEIAAVRVFASGEARGHAIPSLSRGETAVDAAHETRREVWHEGRSTAARVIACETLAPDQVVLGPAVIEHDDATTWIPPGWTACGGARDTLVLERSP